MQLMLVSLPLEGYTDKIKKGFSQAIFSITTRKAFPSPMISFSDADLLDVIPHEDDPLSFQSS